MFSKFVNRDFCRVGIIALTSLIMGTGIVSCSLAPQPSTMTLDGYASHTIPNGFTNGCQQANSVRLDQQAPKAR